MGDGLPKVQLMETSSFHSPNVSARKKMPAVVGKGLSASRRSPISGTDYSGRDNITVEDCFWIARLVMKHSFSVSELQTVRSVHVANDPSQVVSVHYVRDSGVVSVEVLDSQQSTAKALDIFPTNGGQCHTPPHRVGRAVKFAKMIVFIENFKIIIKTLNTLINGK